MGKTTDEDLHALAALAEAAMGGKWVARGNGYSHDVIREPGGAPDDGGDIVASTWNRKDADFIAAASPDVVRELIDRVLKAEAIVVLAAKVLEDVDWDKHLLAFEGRRCAPCDMGRDDEHELLDHHSVQVSFADMLRLRRAIESQS